MAAISLAGRACVGRDARPWVPRQFSVQRNGQFLRLHLDRQCAKDVVALPALTVADAWAVRVVARWGAARCPAPCRELARGCQWAWGGKELVCEQAHPELRPLGVLPRVARRAALGALPVARQWQTDV